MKIIGMIPARGGSTRFNNKPLAQICGKPMVYWVWKHSKEVSCFQEVYVATDSEEIKSVAEEFGAQVLMTSKDCETATERLYEVSHMVEADLYVMINGDEPLVFAEDIIKCIPKKIPEDGFYVSNLMTDFSNPVEVIDPTNLKIVTRYSHFPTIGMNQTTKAFAFLFPVLRFHFPKEKWIIYIINLLALALLPMLHWSIIITCHAVLLKR